MDLVLNYNKDKTHLEVKVSIPPARLATDDKCYETPDIIAALNGLDVNTKNMECVTGTRLYNYTGQTSGTWVFRFTEPQVQEIATIPESKTSKKAKAVSKKAPETSKSKAPKKAATKPKPAPKTTASSTKDVLSRLQKS